MDKEFQHDGENGFRYRFINPPEALADFVENIGMFENNSAEASEIVIIPDGRIDLFFTRSSSEPFHVMLMGLETEPDQRSVLPGTRTFCVSFKPLGLEYLMHMSIAPFLNKGQSLPDGFWNISESDLEDFDLFAEKAIQTLTTLLPGSIDERKRELFRLVYAAHGEMHVQELSEKVFWSSRQINRYFNQLLGLSLKTFCKILRFRESLKHIADGRIYPELNFTDQNHFIKEIKKFSGVAPRELFKNKNDRFILLSVLKPK
ncbi:MAG: AraC family transcriptional regulator [Chitinophagaceae bacterium]|nr:MAG: AraC family transcriptional regulator [Chitinophagaceae bacterium]